MRGGKWGSHLAADTPLSRRHQRAAQLLKLVAGDALFRQLEHREEVVDLVGKVGKAGGEQGPKAGITPGGRPPIAGPPL
jgi:hypothetical protein